MDDNKITVLVVDDDRRMVRTISDILTVHGYAAREAYSGEEAVGLAAASPFDCVLMDIKMPGIGGVAALEMIKARAPGLPVVLMSAFATEEQAAEAKRRGAYAVLAKPLDLQMILSFLSLLRNEESVLIVDDDPLFCRTLADILRGRGCRVESEAEPARVLSRMEAEYKLVVLLDIKLGASNGLDILRAIRARYPTKPVVLVTGYREEMADSVRQGLQIGAYACMYKPLQNEALLGTIREIRQRKLRAVLGEPFEIAERGEYARP